MPEETRYSIRPCRRIEELEACVHLQQQVWGYPESELYPLRLFVNLTHIGGQVLGAFRRERGAKKTELVGFVTAMPAWREGRRYLHSLSLGVMAGHENHGLGRRLKMEQRRLAMEAGLNLIEWTFDPTRAKNAFLNLVRLGGFVRRYYPNYYGHVESRLQLGLPSDRVVCEWHLGSARVRASAGEIVRRRAAQPRSQKPAATIEIPLDFGALAASDPAEALRLQASVRRQFQRYLGQGLAATGIERDERAAHYILEPTT